MNTLIILNIYRQLICTTCSFKADLFFSGVFRSSSCSSSSSAVVLFAGKQEVTRLHEHYWPPTPPTTGQTGLLQGPSAALFGSPLCIAMVTMVTTYPASCQTFPASFHGCWWKRGAFLQWRLLVDAGGKFRVFSPSR